jgi:IS30 family transposase
MELRERGWTVRAAGREVGVARTTASNWARGYKTYRNGEVVGFVPPLERLAVRQIARGSYHRRNASRSPTCATQA